MESETNNTSTAHVLFPSTQSQSCNNITNNTNTSNLVLLPTLYPKLQLALSHLYSSSYHSSPILISNSSPHDEQQQQQRQNNQQRYNQLKQHQEEPKFDAHDFLIKFQSRNRRRGILASASARCASVALSPNSSSIGTISAGTTVRNRSRNDDNNNNASSNNGTAAGLLQRDGSTFYACLPLLAFFRHEGGNDDNNTMASSTTPSTTAERIFCSQTLLHRVGRMKLIDALDYEFELFSSAFSSWEVDINNGSRAIVESEEDYRRRCCGVCRTCRGEGGVSIPCQGLSSSNNTTGQQYQNNNCLHQQMQQQQQQQKPQYWLEFIKYHGEKISNYHPLLGHVLSAYYESNVSKILQQQTTHQSSQSNNYNVSSDDTTTTEEEARIKGEMTMLVYATLSYLSVYHDLLRSQQEKHHQQQQQHNIGGTQAAAVGHQIAYNLSSAMAIVALRMRYSPSMIRQSSSSPSLNDTTATTTTTTLPIVTAVLRAYESVSFIIKSSSTSFPELLKFHDLSSITTTSNNNTNTNTIHERVMDQCILLALSSIPESILNKEDKTRRGYLSIDPICLKYAKTELYCPITGLNLVLEMFGTIANRYSGDDAGSSSGSSGVKEESESIAMMEKHLHGMMLVTCRRWAATVPLPIDFVNRTVPLSLRYITPISSSPSTSPSMEILTTVRKEAFAYLLHIYEAANYDEDDENNAVAVRIKRKKNKAKRRQKNKDNKGNSTGDIGVVDDDDETNKDNDTVRQRNEELAKEEEKYHKSLAACRTAFLSQDAMMASLLSVLQDATNHNNDTNATMTMIEGEGPVGCVVASASACLPHLMRYGSECIGENGVVGVDLQSVVLNLLESLRMICSSPDPSVRALCREHIVIIHRSLVVALPLSIPTLLRKIVPIAEVKNAIVDCLCNCAIRLVEGCAYPPKYFADLSLDGDEELEIERNDVRALIRSICSLDEYQPTMGDGSGESDIIPVSMILLERILRLVGGSIGGTSSGSGCASDLPSEPVVHVFSSLAKPLIRVAQLYLSNATPLQPSFSIMARDLLLLAIRSLSSSCKDTLKVFASVALNAPLPPEIVPVSRLVCLATASYEPMISCIVDAVNGGKIGQEFLLPLQDCISSCTIVSLVSLERIPELTHPSSLGFTIYDIRGAMRGPGGEDHVGVLALHRLSLDGKLLAWHVLDCATNSVDEVGGSIIDSYPSSQFPNPCSSSSYFLTRLCHLHEILKAFEIERGYNVWHGSGVTPKSRRILLTTITHLASMVVGKEDGRWQDKQSCHNTIEKQQEREMFSSQLNNLFQRPLANLSITDERRDICDAEKMFHICEAILDLASFPSNLTSSLFSVDRLRNQDTCATAGIEMIMKFGVSGYELVSKTAIAKTIDAQKLSDVCLQWGRLRAAILCLFRSCTDFSTLICDAVVALNCAESKAAEYYFQSILAQQHFDNALFNDLVIGEEAISAGAFIVLLGEKIEYDTFQLSKKNGEDKMRLIGNCFGYISVLSKSQDQILSVISLEYVEIGNDPRATMAEAWFIAINALLLFYSEIDDSISNNSEALCLVGSTLRLLVQLTLFKRLDNNKSDIHHSNPCQGVSLDGPQTLAMIEFLCTAIETIGQRIFPMISEQLEHRVVFNLSSIASVGQVSPSLLGGGIISAVLFRGASGAFPPWAIEGIPNIYSLLFSACGSCCDNFCIILNAGADLKFGETGFGCVNANKKLAGRFFDKIGDNARNNFFAKVREISSKKDGNRWRLFKVLLKGVCGGKKKATSFNLKPQQTKWNVDRI